MSFVARDKLADWLEQRAEEEMKSVSAVCQDIVAAEYRRQNPLQGGTEDEQGAENVEPAVLDEERKYEMPSKKAADAFRAALKGHLSQNDDKRLKTVTVASGTPERDVAKAMSEVGEKA